MRQTRSHARTSPQPSGVVAALYVCVRQTDSPQIQSSQRQAVEWWAGHNGFASRQRVVFTDTIRSRIDPVARPELERLRRHVKERSLPITAVFCASRLRIAPTLPEYLRLRAEFSRCGVPVIPLAEPSTASETAAEDLAWTALALLDEMRRVTT